MRKMVSLQHLPAQSYIRFAFLFSAASPTKLSIEISVAFRTDKQVKVILINTVFSNINHRETLTKCLRFWKVA